jgi:uncharacterized protein (TIGR01777 family)
MKYLITGASGLIGKKLVNKLLEQNASINILTTNKNLKSSNKNINKFYWNPELNKIDSNCINGVHIIINLAGSPIAQLWTKSSKKSILLSRTNSVKLLYQIILEKKSKIDHFFCASAIGIYKSDNSYTHTESSQNTSNSFLGNTVSKWETSCKKLKEQKINVTILRIGLVLSLNGGLLKPIALSVKYFLGTWFGNGGNIYSWIHIDDLVDSILFLLNNNKTGIYNLVAPNPISSRLFTLEISKVLNKKILLPPIPSFLIKIITGSMSELFLFSQNVSSKKIIVEGFNFQYKSISSALNNLLK